MSILEIAAACGFGSNFGKIYKAYYGKTPRETRKERLVWLKEKKWQISQKMHE